MRVHLDLANGNITLRYSDGDITINDDMPFSALCEALVHTPRQTPFQRFILCAKSRIEDAWFMLLDRFKHTHNHNKRKTR